MRDRLQVEILDIYRCLSGRILNGIPNNETIKLIGFKEHDGTVSRRGRADGIERRSFDGLIQGLREVDPDTPPMNYWHWTSFWTNGESVKMLSSFSNMKVKMAVTAALPSIVISCPHRRDSDQNCFLFAVQ